MFPAGQHGEIVLAEVIKHDKSCAAKQIKEETYKDKQRRRELEEQTQPSGK